ncbi:MAG: alpha/beta fold hydrolase [Deltaproteobacteria bacterium]|nr:alpha/beta fold hydrolase [Deltaproteobacteria bacterium]
MPASSPVAPSRTGLAPVNGLQIYFEIRGTGEPLVLLHGGLGAVEMFGPTLDALAAHRQVIGIDLQGHGHTALGDRPMSLEAMADDVDGVLAYLKIPTADVMGYSMGGAVALQTAIRHPARVRKLVAVSVPIKRTGWYPEIQQGMGMVSAAAAEPMKHTPMYELYARIAPRVEDWPVLLDRMGQMMGADYDWSADAAKLPMPVMIVIGDADAVMPAAALELFGLLGGARRDAGWDGAGRPASQLAILPGRTHYDIFVAPALVATVLPFLDAPAAK